MWTYIGTLDGTYIGSIVVGANNQIIFSEYTGALKVLDADGNLLFTHDLGDNLTLASPIALANTGQFFIGGNDNKLHCFGTPVRVGCSALPLFAKIFNV